MHWYVDKIQNYFAISRMWSGDFVFTCNHVKGETGRAKTSPNVPFHPSAV